MTGKKSRSGVAPRTTAEWVSLALSTLLLACVAGTVIFLWLNPSNKPARFRVERGAIRQEESHYYLPVKVKNEGDATGAQVTVEGKLKGAGGEETASTTFDFIPARSSAEGILVFNADPTQAEVSVTSFQQP